MSRRWVPRAAYNASLHLGQSVFRSAEGCLVTCVNNYAWVDLRTGKPPTADGAVLLQKHFACLPCEVNKYYAVWNYSRPGGRYGACYPCPANTNTIAGRDVMCESIAGYGVPHGTARNVTVVMVTSDTKVELTVPSVRMPFVRASTTAYFKCCANDTDCRIFNKYEIDTNQNSLNKDSAWDRCTRLSSEVPRRRLLQSGGAIEACKVAQYNGARGDDTCYACPEGGAPPPPSLRAFFMIFFSGASMPADSYQTSTSLRSCLCLPGYYRDAQSGGCRACGLNRHRTSHMNESEGCVSCPPGMMTPTETSANCYCEPGRYLNASQQCGECPAGSYCEGGSRVTQCPPNSQSPAGARTRSDCVCQTGYFGGLAQPNSVCMRKPFAQSCVGDVCNCSTGWYPVYYDEGRTMRCVSDCALGEYAQIEPQTFRKVGCVKCPLHTYSASRQTVEVAGRSPQQQCTPCPLNFETADTGQTSVLACVCRRGELQNASTVCGMCAAGAYLEPLEEVCRACPAGSTSPAGSIGLVSCTCPQGSRLKHDAVCELCPRNTYSASAGRSCTPCPWPMVTSGEGSKSFAACQCPEGYYQHAGRCVQLV